MTDTLLSVLADWWLVGLAVLVLLALSAFFSGSETALTGASKARMHQLAKNGDARAQAVLALRDRKESMIGAILFGNNLVNILASALATSAFLAVFGDAGVAYATLVMTALVLIFAEVLPKTWAITHPDRMALTVAYIMRLITVLFSPVTGFVQIVVAGTLRLFGVRLQEDEDEEHKVEELRGVIDLHEGEDPHERIMLRSILDLDDVEVEDVMTHRSNVVMVDVNDPVEDNITKILDSAYTRIPLVQGDPDNILGILHAKPLWRAVRANRAQGHAIDLKDLASAPWFIPESTTLLDQLHAFRERREHFAVVVDEYGSFQGIVTLEDILEEIVGEIDDEQDIAVHGIHAQADGSYIIDGAVTLRDVNRDLDWELPDDDAATIAGLILHEARCIPDAGQVFRFYGYQFEVLRRQRNRIKTLRVTPPNQQGSETGDDPVPA
ncbi:HlyC/CorC family transporter [Aestuariispira ectoiniformans]|uniref:HlyC/CorC family transporter n=1 Tax=Aestuariispira ectoiniformans TaxID=2775080 RepID=UPI00223C28E6|nr:HlyC/CorC family transporter [Aestuariispira ectoiniformans]